MSESTKIAWTDSTFNPWIGCTKIGPGCDHCYAEAQDSRKRWGGVAHWGAGVPRYRTSASNWAQPILWNKKAAASGKPWRVFCASLADVFDNEWPEGARDDLWRLIEETPHLSWLLVTKRIGNVARMVPSLDWLAMHDNVRILITVVNQEEADRDIPKLLELPCNNGISYEPALSAVDWSPWLRGWTGRNSGLPAPLSTNLERLPDIRAVEWIIVGGESGPKARPFDLAWARSTIEQGKAAGVPVFVKQLGATPLETFAPGCDHFLSLQDRAGADPAEWPESLRVREFPE